MSAVLTKYGPPDVLVWSPVAMPEPGPGQIRIRVLAAGVGPTDPKIRRGDHAADYGVALAIPTPDRAPDALDQTMPLLASGTLRLRAQRVLPMHDAALAHELLDTGQAHEKLVLTTS